jgi:N6-L-threonylcarbamoyladenine synthase
LKQHKKYGGVIPEIATRAHLKNIDKVFAVALKEAGIIPGDIGLIVSGWNVKEQQFLINFE